MASYHWSGDCNNICHGVTILVLNNVVMVQLVIQTIPNMCLRKTVPFFIGITRSLKCFRDSIPHALAEAFGEPKPDPSPDSIHNMQPPQSPSPSAFPPASFLSTLGHDDSAAPGARTASVKLARAKPKLPSWLTPAGGSPSAILSPPTPLLVRQSVERSVSRTMVAESGGVVYLGGFVDVRFRGVSRLYQCKLRARELTVHAYFGC